MLGALFGSDNDRAVSVPWTTNDDGWGSWGGNDSVGTWAGAHVDERTATQLLAVYGSASFITDEISTLPVNIEGIQRPSWVDQPSDGVDRIAWLGQIVWSLLLSGNAYVHVIRNARGFVIAADVLYPDNVAVRREGGRKVFTVSGQPAAGREMVHIAGRMRPGDVCGMSPVEWCRQTIGLGLAATKYGAEFFDGEGNMPGVIELPQDAQPDTMRDLAAQWQRKRKQSGRGMPGVLKGGAQWKPTGVNHEQAQFLASRKWNAAEIAGQIFLLDPSDLGIPVEGSSLTYANLEQRNTRRLQVALMPWMRRIETALTPLVTAGEYKFDVDSRLRGNTRESYETLGVAIGNGLLTVNEGREVIGRSPIEPTETAIDDDNFF